MYPPQTRFLVVDDAPNVREYVVSILKKCGYENYAEAENGQQALNVLKESSGGNAPFEIILCDWHMPEMNGIEVLEHIRKDRHLHDLKFIMVTSEGESGKVIDAIHRGVNNYITKPFTKETLIRKLAEMWKKNA